MKLASKVAFAMSVSALWSAKNGSHLSKRLERGRLRVSFKGLMVFDREMPSCSEEASS